MTRRIKEDSDNFLLLFIKRGKLSSATWALMLIKTGEGVLVTLQSVVLSVRKGWAFSYDLVLIVEVVGPFGHNVQLGLVCFSLFGSV